MCNVLYNIVQLLFSAKHYVAVPNLVHCALNLCKNINDSDVKKSTVKWSMAELYLILGQAKFYNGNRNSSISSLRLALTYCEVRTHVARNACKVLLLQAYFEKTCLQHIWEEAKNATYSIYLLIIADTFDVEYFPISYNPFNNNYCSYSFFQDILSQPDTPLILFYLLYILESFSYTFQCFFNLNLILFIANFIFLIFKLGICLWMISIYIYYILYTMYRTLLCLNLFCKGIRQMGICLWMISIYIYYILYTLYRTLFRLNLFWE